MYFLFYFFLFLVTSLSLTALTASGWQFDQQLSGLRTLYPAIFPFSTDYTFMRHVLSRLDTKVYIYRCATNERIKFLNFLKINNRYDNIREYGKDKVFVPKFCHQNLLSERYRWTVRQSSVSQDDSSRYQTKLCKQELEENTSKTEKVLMIPGLVIELLS